MSIKSNSSLSKLAVIVDNKHKQWKNAKRVEQEKATEYQEAWLTYMHECRKAGYCGGCKQELDFCCCIPCSLLTK